MNATPRFDERVVRQRAEMWAGRYVNETDAWPTDEAMREAFAGCVGACPVELYPAVRSEVFAWRKENGKLSRLGEA